MAPLAHCQRGFHAQRRSTPPSLLEGTLTLLHLQLTSPWLMHRHPFGESPLSTVSPERVASLASSHALGLRMHLVCGRLLHVEAFSADLLGSRIPSQ